jgi:ankyrin repeat protein
MFSASGKPDIHKSSQKGDLPKVKSILQNDPYLINSKDNDGLTPLQIAAREGHVEVCRYLLDSGASVVSGFSALHYAAWKGHLDVVKLLLSRRFEVNALTSGSRDTPLHLAVIGGNCEVVKLLLSEGADADFRDALGMSPLMDAERKGQTDIVTILKMSNR